MMDSDKIRQGITVGAALMRLAMRIFDAIGRDEPEAVDDILSSPLAVAAVREEARRAAAEKFGDA